MRLLALLPLLSSLALADVVLKNNGTSIGPVTNLDCSVDGGLVCARAAGGGKLSCASATTTTPGCVDTGTQNWSGLKNFAASVTIDGGLLVTGNLTVDGGAYVQGVVTTDGGLNLAGPASALLIQGSAGTSGQYLKTTGPGVAPTWGTLPSSVSEATWAAQCSTCAVSDGTTNRFVGPYWTVNRTVTRVDCSWVTPGTVGSTSATMQIYNVTGSASVCTCAIGACNTAAGTPLSCTCSGSVGGGSLLIADLSAKGDCTVAPQGISCNVHMTP